MHIARQIFRQIVQIRRRRASARQGEVVQSDGKYASKMCASDLISGSLYIIANFLVKVKLFLLFFAPLCNIAFKLLTQSFFCDNITLEIVQQKQMSGFRLSTFPIIQQEEQIGRAHV